VNSMVPVLSSGAASNFHFFTASVAAPTNTGWPPKTLVSFTVPEGATTTTNLTVPLMLIRRARSGYTGATLLLTLRVSSSCANAPLGHTTPRSKVMHINERMVLLANFHLPDDTDSSKCVGATVCIAERRSSAIWTPDCCIPPTNSSKVIWIGLLKFP